MLPKPKSCYGCPFYGDGKGFVPDELHDYAPVFIVGQNPGAEEEAQGKPFVGPTGEMMARDYFPRAALNRDKVSIGNIVRCRLNHTNELPPADAVVTRDAIAHCTRSHLKVPDGTRLIVTQGDYAALGMIGDSHATTWRGWLVPLVGTQAHGLHLTEPWVPQTGDLPVLVTVHLARLFRDPDLTLPTLRDWSKVPAILSGKWPRRPPAFETTVPSEVDGPVVLDTEYRETGPRPVDKEMSLWSMATRDGRVWVQSWWPSTPILTDGPIVSQSWDADLFALRAVFQNLERTGPPEQLEDTMLKHSVLYSDMPHDLGFLGSIYSSMNRWKHLRESQAKELYAGCDAFGTMEVDAALDRELDSDPPSRVVYERYVRPLVPIIHRSRMTGLRTDQRRIEEVRSLLASQVHEAGLRASAAAGWPISLTSNPQVGFHIYELEGLPQPRKKRRKR